MDMSYENIDIEEQGLNRDDLAKITGGHTVPQIIINDKAIGGFNELLQLNNSGKLKELLKYYDNKALFGIRKYFKIP